MLNLTMDGNTLKVVLSYEDTGDYEKTEGYIVDKPYGYWSKFNGDNTSFVVLDVDVIDRHSGKKRLAVIVLPNVCEPREGLSDWRNNLSFGIRPEAFSLAEKYIMTRNGVDIYD